MKTEVAAGSQVCATESLAFLPAPKTLKGAARGILFPERKGWAAGLF